MQNHPHHTLDPSIISQSVFHHGPGPDMAATTASQDAIEARHSAGKLAPYFEGDVLRSSFGTSYLWPRPLPERLYMIVLGHLTPIPDGMVIDRPRAQSRALIATKPRKRTLVPGNKAKAAGEWSERFEKARRGYLLSLAAVAMRAEAIDYPRRSYTAQRCVSAI